MIRRHKRADDPNELPLFLTFLDGFHDGFHVSSRINSSISGITPFTNPKLCTGKLRANTPNTISAYFDVHFGQMCDTSTGILHVTKKRGSHSVENCSLSIRVMSRSRSRERNKRTRKQTENVALHGGFAIGNAAHDQANELLRVLPHRVFEALDEQIECAEASACYAVATVRIVQLDAEILRRLAGGREIGHELGQKRLE